MVGRWCWITFILIWMMVEQGPTVLAIDADWDCLDVFSLPYHLFFLLFSGDGSI